MDEINTTAQEDNSKENTPKKKLSTLESIDARMAKLQQQRRKEVQRLSSEKRKQRNHRLLTEGGTVEMVLGEELSLALLAGLLEENKQLFNDLNNGKSIELIALGNKLLAEAKDKKNPHNKKSGDLNNESN